MNGKLDGTAWLIQARAAAIMMDFHIHKQFKTKVRTGWKKPLDDESQRLDHKVDRETPQWHSVFESGTLSPKT